MHHVPGKNRNERLDRSLEELVPPTSFARIIDAFVDALDLASFCFTYFDLNEEGRPPYHSGLMLKLCLYGYHHGIRPCRKLADACRLNIEVHTSSARSSASVVLNTYSCAVRQPYWEKSS
jgi:transposase